MFNGRFTDSLMFYGLSLNIGSLTGDLFLNSFLMAAVEIPANLLCMLMMGKLGRRVSICGALLFAALTMFGNIPLLYRKGTQMIYYFYCALGFSL